MPSCVLHGTPMQVCCMARARMAPLCMRWPAVPPTHRVELVWAPQLGCSHRPVRVVVVHERRRESKLPGVVEPCSERCLPCLLHGERRRVPDVSVVVELLQQRECFAADPFGVRGHAAAVATQEVDEGGGWRAGGC